MIKVWTMVCSEADRIIHLLNFLHHLHPHIHHINHHHITHQLIFLYYLHLRIHHSNHHYITHRLIFLNHHYYTLTFINESTTCVIQRLQCNQKTPTLCSKIKSFIQGVRLRTRYATSSLTIKAARTSCLEHL